MRLDYDVIPDAAASLGLIVLQSDETIEDEFRALCQSNVSLLVSRVPSGEEVTSETLAAMEGHISAAAHLFPRGKSFDVLGYGCTSGTAQISPENVATQLRKGAQFKAASEPVSALLAACEFHGIKRLAFLSPYIAPVSEKLRNILADHGVQSPVFGSFEEPSEAKVARIDPASIRAAALALLKGAAVDGLFLSCTNLRTLPIIAELQETTGLPVLSSNLVLAWHMQRLAGVMPSNQAPASLLPDRF